MQPQTDGRTTGEVQSVPLVCGPSHGIGEQRLAGRQQRFAEGSGGGTGGIDGTAVIGRSGGGGDIGGGGGAGLTTSGSPGFGGGAGSSDLVNSDGGGAGLGGAVFVQGAAA